MPDKLTPVQLANRLFAGGHIPRAARYRHKKSGDQYMVLSLTLRESDLEPMVVYAPTDEDMLGYSISFVRPAAEFREKFEKVKA